MLKIYSIILYIKGHIILKIYDLIGNYTEYICITSKYTIDKKCKILRKCCKYCERLKKTIA